MCQSSPNRTERDNVYYFEAVVVNVLECVLNKSERKKEIDYLPSVRVSNRKHKMKTLIFLQFFASVTKEVGAFICRLPVVL